MPSALLQLNFVTFVLDNVLEENDVVQQKKKYYTGDREITWLDFGHSTFDSAV